MATTKEAKVKFSADTSEFTAGIKQANSSLTQLRSELKLNKAQADSAGDSIENLSDRQRILAQEYEASQSKIDALTNKLEAAKSAFGENSTEVQKLETQLNNARTAQTRIQQEIDATAQALGEMEAASQQAGSALGKMEGDLRAQEGELQRLKTAYNQVAAEQGETSDEARALAQQIQRTSRDVADSRDSFNQARTAADKFDATLDKVGDTARDTGDDLGVMDIALGDFISDTAQSAIGALGDLEESTRQYRNEQNKLEAVSQTTGQSIDVLKDGYADLYAITGDETLASTAVLNMSAMGVSAKDQSVLVNAAAGAWAAYGDSIPLDGLLESINETTRAGQVTGSFADALNWAKMSSEEWSAALSGNSKAQSAFNKGIQDGMSVEDAFNEALKQCTTTQERQKLVTEAMDAAYGELGTTYQDVNQDVISANDAQRTLQDGLAALGEAVQPITTGFQNLIGTGLQWFVDNLPTLTPIVIAPAVTALVTGLGGLAGVMALLTSPVALVVAAIALLTAGFVALWNSSETFRNGVMTIWTTIQTVFGTLAEWFMTNVVTPIVTYFSGLWPQIQEIWNGIVNVVNIAMTNISNFINSNMSTIQAIWSGIWGVISSVASTVWGVIQTVINTALGVIQGIITTVTGIISGDWSQVWNGISQVASSIWNGIQSTISGVLSGIQGVISSVLGAIASVFGVDLDGIKSTVDTVFNGIKSTIDAVMNTAKSLVKGAIDTISGIFSGANFKLPHISLPHFSISGSFSLMPPSIPTISVSWYAKGGILEAPTIFGSSGSSLLGGGEAGKEAVAPLSDLLGYMMTALDRKFDSSGMGALVDAIEDLADRVISIEIDGKQIARATASDADRVNGSRQQLIKRGVSLA